MLTVKYHKNSHILYSIQEQKEYGPKNLRYVLPSSPKKTWKKGRKIRQTCLDPKSSKATFT